MMIISSTKKNLPYLYSFHPYAAYFSSRCTSLSRASNKTLTMKGVVPFHLVLDSKKVFSPLNKSFAVGIGWVPYSYERIRIFAYNVSSDTRPCFPVWPLS